MVDFLEPKMAEIAAGTGVSDGQSANTIFTKLAEATIGSMDEAGVPEDSMTTAFDSIASRMMTAFDTMDKDDIPSAVNGIMSGAVAALSKISYVEDHSEASGIVDDLAGSFTANIGNIPHSEFAASDIPAVIGAVSAGGVSGLDEWASTGSTFTDFDVNDLGPVMAEVVGGTTAKAGHIVFVDYDSDDLQGALKAITAGATGALDNIELENYDFNDLPEMVSKITEGAVGRLDEITMTGYDADDLPGVMESLTSGASGALDDISMTGYDVEHLDEMTKGIAGGATGGIDQISMTGFESGDVTALLNKATEGSAEGLSDVAMEGFDDTHIAAANAAIESGVSEHKDDLDFTEHGGSFGSDYDPSAYTPDADQHAATAPVYDPNMEHHDPYGGHHPPEHTEHVPPATTTE